MGGILCTVALIEFDKVAGEPLRVNWSKKNWLMQIIWEDFEARLQLWPMPQLKLGVIQGHTPDPMLLMRMEETGTKIMSTVFKDARVKTSLDVRSIRPEEDEHK